MQLDGSSSIYIQQMPGSSKSRYISVAAVSFKRPVCDLRKEEATAPAYQAASVAGGPARSKQHHHRAVLGRTPVAERNAEVYSL